MTPGTAEPVTRPVPLKIQAPPSATTKGKVPIPGSTKPM